MKTKENIELNFMRNFFYALFILLIFRTSSPEEKYSQNIPGEGKLILIIFDFESLSCPLCLESFKDFCETLHSTGLENSALGLLTYQNAADEQNIEKYTKIVEKKLRGFRIGNRIKFQILLDKFHVFEGLNITKPGIILFDLSKGLIKKYKLPITKGELDEFFIPATKN